MVKGSKRSGRRLSFLFAILVFTCVSGVVSAQSFLFGRSGFELTDAAIKELKAAAQKLYLDDSREAGDVEAWQSPDETSFGTVTLVKRHSYEEMPCVRLQHDIEVKAVTEKYRFIVDRCRVASGEWKLL